MFDRVSDIFRRFTGAAVRHDRPAPTGLSQRQRLSEIRARTAVFVGARDETERLACAGAIASGIAGAELVTFADLSRFLHIEESRVVMRRLTDFFLPDEA